MSSSSATDLFAQAIAQSAPWGPFFRKEIFTEAIYPALLNSTNCTSSGEEAQLSCLRALDAGVFLNGTAFQAMVAASVVAQVIYSQAGQLVSTVEPFLPVVGTGIVDDLTDVLFKNGQLPSKNKPFLIGNMRDEGVSFTTFSPNLTLSDPLYGTFTGLIRGQRAPIAEPCSSYQRYPADSFDKCC